MQLRDEQGRVVGIRVTGQSARRSEDYYICYGELTLVARPNIC